VRVEGALFGCGGEPSRDGEQADALVLIVAQRLARHVALRIDEKKQGSWVLNFVNDNLAIMAALTVRFGHVVGDLACVSMDDPLLADSAKFVEAAATVKEEARVLHVLVQSSKAVDSKQQSRRQAATKR